MLRARGNRESNFCSRNGRRGPSYLSGVHRYCSFGTLSPLVLELGAGILPSVTAFDHFRDKDLVTRAANLDARPVRSDRPGVALALGGGFARGFAHLGVLQVFEQNHIAISHIAGTSVGSILGAAYASGAPLARIIATCRTLRFRDIARWRVSRLGLASNHRLADLIENVFEAHRFEDLRIPMAVVATNLNTGEPVVFTEGSLVDPIRASCAYPGIFEPVEIGTRWLVDGGLRPRSRRMRRATWERNLWWAFPSACRTGTAARRRMFSR